MWLQNKQIKIKCGLLARHDTVWMVGGSNSDRGRDFSAPVQTGPEHIQPLYNWHRVSLTGGETAGAWRCPPTPSSVEVKERIKIYIYSLSESSCLL